MANEVKRMIDPPRGGANKRQADIEALAGTIFVKMLMVERGTKIPSSVAKDALNAANEFFKVADNIEG